MRRGERGANSLAGIAVMAVLLVLVGVLVWKIRSPHVQGTIVADPLETPLPQTKPAKITLYFDRSMSMRGFVKDPQPGALYTKFVQEVETVLSTNVASDVSASGFGVKVAPVKNYDYRKLDFYSEKETHIEDAISDARASGGLALIITDMFEDEHEVAKLIAPLRNYVNKDEGIGVIGALTSFDGKRPAVPGIEWENNQFFEHTGTLPFYVLVLGKTQEVAQTLQVLEAKIFGGAAFCGQKKDCDAFSVMISKRAARLLSERDESGKRVALGKEPIGVQEVTLVPGWSNDARVKQLEFLQLKKEGTSKFELRIPALWIHSPALNADVRLPQPKVTAFRAAKSAAGMRNAFPPEGWESAPEAAAALSVEPCKLDPKPEFLTCPVQLTGKLPTTDQYLFAIDVPLGTSRGIDFRLWSFDQSEARQLARNGFGGERGRTRNFAMLMTGLLDEAQKDPAPLAARAYLVAHRK